MAKANEAPSGIGLGDGDAVNSLRCVAPKLSSAEVRLAMRHYGRCIREMQRMMEIGSGSGDERSVNVALLCTVICICFELCMDEPLAALSHLEHGLNIIASNHAAGTPTPNASHVAR